MNVLKNKSVRIGLLAAGLVLILLILFACGVLPPGKGLGAASLLPIGSDKVSIHFITPDAEIVKVVEKGSDVTIDPGDEIENYTFIGWRDQQGNLEKRTSVKVFQNIYYSAVYAVSLQTEAHVPYLFPNKYGMFLPDGEMTRSDAAMMFYALLSVPITGNEGFLDVTKSDPCCQAASALKELGVVSGSRFHPNEGITKAELLDMLAAFYPPARGSYTFSDLTDGDGCYPAFCTAAEHEWIDAGDQVKAEPDHIMTRAETAKLMNCVLGRIGADKLTVRQVGYLVDVNKNDACYVDMAEACVPHSFSLEDGAETWTESTPISKMSAGVYLFGRNVYAVDRSGHLVSNGEWDGFSFDTNGVYTSGNAELDELIRDVFDQILNDSMTQEEMLRAAYDYTVDTYNYRKRNMYYYKDTSWLMDEAYTMLTTKKGNCYNFAAAFCMMARALGYDAKVYSAFIGPDYRPHAWVDITIDGQLYIFDPEIEYSYKRDYKTADMYMLTPEAAAKWTYTR